MDGIGELRAGSRMHGAPGLVTAVRAILAHRADAMVQLRATLEEDPGLAVGHAICGLLQRMLAHREASAEAGRALDAARAALRDGGGGARDHAFVAALVAWHEDGDMEAAAHHLEARLALEPHDVAALKLAHAVRFMLGDPAGMRLAVERALPAWSEAEPEFGFVLGCHAFALEETGAAEAAERAGRRAVELEPSDLWGAHAVAHVLEAQGRAREGLAWLRARESAMRHAGGFARHIVWHSALFHLHLGDGEAALGLYDARMRGAPLDDYRDLANAASLLWRLQAQRVPVGAARWEELAAISERRIGDHSLVFADLHHVLVLAATGRTDALTAFLAGMRGRALRDVDTQARVYAGVGLAAGHGIAAAAGGDASAAQDLLGAVRSRLQMVGGSHAQRDLFARIGIEAGLAAGQMLSAQAALAERAGWRVPGAWEATCHASLCERDPKESAAGAAADDGEAGPDAMGWSRGRVPGRVGASAVVACTTSAADQRAWPRHAPSGVATPFPDPSMASASDAVRPR